VRCQAEQLAEAAAETAVADAAAEVVKGALCA